METRSNVNDQGAENNKELRGKKEQELAMLKNGDLENDEQVLIDDSEEFIVKKKEEKVKDVQKAASFFQLQYALSTPCDNVIMIIALLGSLGMGISMPLFSVIFGGSINTFGTLNTKGNETFLSDISSLCLKFVYVGLGIWFASYLMIWLWGYNGRVIAKRIKEKYFELLMSQEQGWFDAQNVNEFSTKIQTQVKTIEMGVSFKF
jgi:ATP-binding cassette subfamily B (MDR/TAP) protein 1